MNSSSRDYEGDIAAIIISYNPSIDTLRLNINTLLQQLNFVVLIDNSTNIDSQKEIKLAFENAKNVKLISLADNIGIAGAQNIGYDICDSMNFKYVFEFDQDSRVTPGFVSSMRTSFQSIASSLDVELVALGPVPKDSDTGKAYRVFKATSPFVVNYTLSSGLLVDLAKYHKIGKKIDHLFIDFVDWEWCFRAKYLGYTVMIDPAIELKHSLGSGRQQIFGLASVGIPAPIRHYYAFRNLIFLNKLHYIPITWKLKYSTITLMKLFIFPLLMKDGFLRLKFMLKGIVDGAIGRGGRVDRQ